MPNIEVDFSAGPKWMCRCGKSPVAKLYLLWARPDPRHQRRDVCYRCNLYCQACAANAEKMFPIYKDGRDQHFQMFDVCITCRTKKLAVNQILEQVMGQLVGYLPSTDLKCALRNVTTG
jgi:hypothetical protein